MSQPFNVHNPVGHKRARTLVAKSRARSSQCCGLSSVLFNSWEGKCSEILAIPSYSKNLRVNKDIWYDMKPLSHRYSLTITHSVRQTQWHSALWARFFLPNVLAADQAGSRVNKSTQLFYTFKPYPLKVIHRGSPVCLI